MESKCLVVSNLPETATEETIKECFQRHGHIQSIKINDQHFAFIVFLDIHTALKAHHAENILDKQQLQTTFYDGSKIFLETSPIASSIVEPSSLSPSSITTNTLIDKTITIIHEDRSHALYSPEENTRHQVVPMKYDSDSSRNNKRKIPSSTNLKTTEIKSQRRKYETSSSSSSERSHSSSKHRRQKRQSPNLNHFKTKILKIYHLPSKMSTQSLRETLRNIFMDFKKSSHLLNIKIFDNYALLTFRKSEDVDKALLFIITKSINGIKLKAEPYDSSITDLDIDEYSVKATRTLYIGNLRAEISYQELREIYSVYGEIIEIEIKRQHSQIFAFIQYADIKSVVKALKSKFTHDHSIKLGFGKSQPTNILWLDDLPLNVNELMLRSFIIHLTNLSSNEILNIYIDNRNNNQKTQTNQCLIYFINTIVAQNAINLIRGKLFDTKRIQVDFASRVFLTKFSDIIQEINEKKNNDRWTNQSYRRYSKVSDTGSSIICNSTRRHSSSSSNHSIISNQKKLIKSETDKHINTERIFDWLMHNHHSDINEDEQEEDNNSQEQILIETKKPNFQTKIIPLETDSLFIQSDIRLKIYSSLNKSTSYFRFPNFAKNLIKSSNILNPKAYLKHSLNEDLSINNELDERIKLLDKQIQISSSILSSVMPSTTTLLKFDQISTSTSLHSTVPSSLSNENSSIKFKHKSIPPPLSVITTLPLSSNNNDSPIFPTPKSMTSTSSLENSHYSPGTTFSPISKQQTLNNSPKPTVLKSILKQPYHLSQSKSNETRKAVHIISTKSSLESTIKQTLISNDKKKSIVQHLIETKKSLTIPSKTSQQSNQLNKIPKSSEIKKKSLTISNKNLLLKNETIKSKSQILVKKSESKLRIHSNNNNKITKKSSNDLSKNKLKLKQTSCMYDRIKERSRHDQTRNNSLSKKDNDIQPLKRSNVNNKTPIIFDSEIFDTEENNDEKKINSSQIILTKFKKKEFILKKKLKSKLLIKKRLSTDNLNRSSKKIKPKSNIQDKPIKETNNDDNQQSTTILIIKNEELNLDNDKILKLDNSIDFKQSEEIIPISSITQKENFSEKDNSNSQNLTDKSTSELLINKSSEKILITTDQSHIINTNQSISTSQSDKITSFYIPSLTTNESVNQIDSLSICNHKHSSTSLHLFPQIQTSDNNLFTPLLHQHFRYPLFTPLPPDSPPLSTRTRSTSSCSSIIGNSFYNTILTGQQHCYDKESRRDSLSKLSITSSQYNESDSTSSLRYSSELYGYPSSSNTQQMLNSFANEFYRINDIQSCDPYDIQWEGNISLKTDQAYIKTQLIAGNSQIARISINYWNLNLNHNLRISQRMRLEEIQLDGVKKHMQIDNDYCLLIGQANGLTPDQIYFEQNHLKNGVIQYLNEKKAAGIINILLPGVVQPVYVVHIFPPCEFASEILQKRAPDAYRCVVQNKTEQIYLLFIITSTLQ